MSEATERDSALAEMIDAVQPDAEPLLLRDEVEKILDRNRRVQTWAGNTDLNVGDLDVRPTIRNGKRYRITKGGRTAATEPDSWPTGESVWGQNFSIGRSITNGTVTFEVVGDDFRNTFDVRQAIYEAWTKKMAKASQYPTTPGVNLATLYDRCKEMRAAYEPVLVG